MLSEKIGKKIILTDLNTALLEADIIVILVDHKEFKAAAETGLNKQKIIDTRGIQRPKPKC
ncbi:UDP-N-acetyl-D-mannosamine dehydrogenase [compost metagenome]